jgi:hypothetical protein
VAECFANACFAKELIKRLRDAELEHRFIYGRERVLKILSRISGRAIGIIDYEYGEWGRTYIDEHIRKIEEIEDMLICEGVGKLKGKLLIIFNPNIEEALIRKVDPALDVKVIKSSKACNTLSKLLKSKKVDNIIRKITERLLSRQ